MLVSLQRRFPEGARAKSPIWLWPNLLSLDAPLVALLWQVLFIRCLHVTVNAQSEILLVAAVWLIYTADRALDAWGGERWTPRHRFYREYWRILLPAWIAILAISTWLAFTQLPAALLRRGCLLLCVVAIYFLAIHCPDFFGGPFGRFRSRTPPVIWSKEASVGLLFALGTSLVAWMNVRTVADASTIALFFLLCWINCAAIQKWETGSWSRATEWPVASVATCVALVAAALLWMHRPVLGGAELLSASAFLWLDRTQRRLSPDALRVLADVALLSPLAFLPLAGIA